MAIRKLNTARFKTFHSYETIDAHTGGEPLRIVLDGVPELSGTTIVEKQKEFKNHYDHIRTQLIGEPRGHSDMYGAVLTEPVHDGSHLGVFFLHNEGYSSMCGHAIIALTEVLVSCDLMDYPEDGVIIYDTPAGIVKATSARLQPTRFKGQSMHTVSFENVPSFVVYLDKTISIPGFQEIRYDIAFGGAYYAYVDIRQLGLSLLDVKASTLIQLGMQLKNAISSVEQLEHPYESALGFLYGTIFTDRPLKENHHSRNACVFANGELDRSATGTGVSGRMALLQARNKVNQSAWISIESFIGSVLDVRYLQTTQFGPYKAVIPEVRGQAYISGKHSFYIDPNDPLRNGFFVE